VSVRDCPRSPRSLFFSDKKPTGRTKSKSARKTAQCEMREAARPESSSSPSELIARIGDDDDDVDTVFDDGKGRLVVGSRWPIMLGTFCVACELVLAFLLAAQLVISLSCVLTYRRLVPSALLQGLAGATAIVYITTEVIRWELGNAFSVVFPSWSVVLKVRFFENEPVDFFLLTNVKRRAFAWACYSPVRWCCECQIRGTETQENDFFIFFFTWWWWRRATKRRPI
jgi:hypothetical protein